MRYPQVVTLALEAQIAGRFAKRTSVMDESGSAPRRFRRLREGAAWNLRSADLSPIELLNAPSKAPAPGPTISFGYFPAPVGAASRSTRVISPPPVCA